MTIVPFPWIHQVIYIPWLPQETCSHWGQDWNFIKLFLIWSPDICSSNFVLTSRPTFSWLFIFLFSFSSFLPFPLFLFLHCSFVLWGGRNNANKYHWHVLTVIQPHCICPRSQRVCFPSLHCSGSRLFCQELSDAGPGLHGTTQV